MAKPTLDKVGPRAERGYDYKFVQQPPEPLICRLCRLPAREPRLSKCCRYNFCESCLSERAKNSRSSNKLITCPVCSDYNFDSDINRQARMEILSLQVYCPNKAMGCSWRGKIPEIRDHMIKEDGCPVVSVTCRCGKTVARGNLTEHYRNDCPVTPEMMMCPYCELRGEKKVIEGEHKEQCGKYPLNCPNNCGIDNIPRDQLTGHLKDECCLQLVPCEYVNVGCVMKVHRKDIVEHCTEYATNHLHLVRTSLATTNDEIAVTKQQVSQVNNQLSATHNDITNMLLQVASMVQTLAENNTQQKSRTFGQKHWQVWLHCRSLQAASRCMESPVIIRMTDYEYKRRCKEVWYSEPFWSHHNGYKVVVKVHANGFADCKGTHLSMGICIKDGPNDKHLAWPAQGTFNITLLNQVADDNQHHVDQVIFNKSTPHHIGGRMAANDDARISAWGKHNFITHEELHKKTASCCYLRNDTIYIHISFKHQ